uniref:KH domain-containing protein n=1 Tax=Strongyloides venezuelensis TaxID=75913 RepID=A0A0K0FDK3_STRVS
MSENTSSTFVKSFTEDTNKRYYNNFYHKKAPWIRNQNYNNYKKNYFYYGQQLEDRPSHEFKKFYTSSNNDIINISIGKSFYLPSSHQIPLERFYKILFTVTLMGNTSIGSSMNLTRCGFIDKANEIANKIYHVSKDDINSLNILDIQLQEIEEITTNMAYDIGLTVVSTKSLRKLKDPQETIINMVTNKNLNPSTSCVPVLISDDKIIFVKRNYNYFKTENIQVQVTKKMNLINCTNVNILGRLIGLHGSTIKDLEATTQSKITIRGRGSRNNFHMDGNFHRQRDYQCYNEPLHIIVSVRDASEVDCYRKLENVRKKIIYILCQKTPNIENNNN